MGGDPLDIEDIFDLLRVERRRAVLWALSDQETSLTLADVAQKVAARESQTPACEISEEDIRRIYRDIYHSHLPKLDEYGVVDFHQESDVVTPTEHIDQLTSYLHLLNKRYCHNSH